MVLLGKRSIDIREVASHTIKGYGFLTSTNTNTTSNEAIAPTLSSINPKKDESIRSTDESATDIALRVSFFVVFIYLAAGYEVAAHTFAKTVKTDKVCAAIARVVSRRTALVTR